MTTVDNYISSVLRKMPHATPNRAQIATELRGHIAERTASGHTLDEVIRQLGDPVRLAESYLAAVPLVSAPLEDRAVAKLIDIVIAAAAMVPIGALVAWLLPFPLEATMPFLFLGCIVGATFGFAIYTIVAEHARGQTIGKHLLGIRVVTESGTRISLGQAFVRQLPMFLQVFWIDVMFSLFTEKKQRAFEVLSKTRAVVASSRTSDG